MLKAFLFFYFVQVQGIQIRWSPLHEEASHAKDVEENPTLRAFLNRGGYHIGLAPIRCSVLIHMSILNVLKQHKLSSNIVSLSGSSTGGLAAAIWASMDHQNENHGYASVFGRNLSRTDCAPKCDKYENFYLNLLDAPINSEMGTLLAIAQKGLLKKYSTDFMKGFRRVPSAEESHLSWVQTMFFIDLMKVKRNFSDTKLPVVISGLQVKDDLPCSVLMSKGNLHLALIGTASPPGNTAPVWIHHNFRITDGYFGDEHGARGYDVLDPEIRPERLLNVVLIDLPGQSWGLNFTRLRENKHLEEAATILMALGQPLLYQGSWQMDEHGFPSLKYRDVVHISHSLWKEALDSPLELARPARSHTVKSYYQEMNAAHVWPKILPGPVLLRLDEFNRRMSKARSDDKNGLSADAPEYIPDSTPMVEGIEVSDEQHLLEEPSLLSAYATFRNASLKMYGGDRYMSSKFLEIPMIPLSLPQSKAVSRLSNKG